jgi:hypothetical protein
MKNRMLAIGLLIAGIPLAACSGGSGDKASGDGSQSAPSSGKDTSQPAQELPANFRKIGGAENGFTAGVPKSWTTVNLSAANARPALKKAGLSNSAVEQTIAVLQKNHAVYALDPKSAQTKGFASNLNGFCQPGTPASAEQVKAQLDQIGAQNVQSNNVTVGGQSAQKTTYVRKAGLTTTTGVQYQVPGSKGQTCTITMTGKKGVATPFAKIGTTIHAL